MDRELDRRDALRLGGLAGLGAVLAACTSSSSPAAPSSSAVSSTRTALSPTSSSVHTATSRPAKPTYAQLAKQLSGELSLPGHRGYDPRSLLYNPRFRGQRAPPAIAHCKNSSDVAACVRFAADGGAPLRIRNGGHSYGGWSSGPGLVVDLALVDGVRVNHSAKTATVGAGALLADVYSKLGAAGVSIGGGSCPTVGITGLTLGGGVGVLARSYGLTCDQLESAQVVTADGKLRTVNTHTDEELFWALRGGGGSFGAVTSLTFTVRSAPRLSTFFYQWSWQAAHEVLSAWQQWVASAPRELWSTCKLLADPGKGAHPTVAGTWIGSGSPSRELAKLLRNVPRPSTSYINPPSSYASTMFAEAGCAGDSAAACVSTALSPAKRQAFAATSAIMTRPLPAAGIAAIADVVESGLDVSGLVEGGVSFDSLGGAVGDAPSDATAFPWRSALADVQYTATWPYADATDNPSRFDAFVRRERAALAPWLGTAAYVNYADPGLAGYANAYWGPNLKRLQQAKKTYDPRNLFSFSQSVPL